MKKIFINSILIIFLGFSLQNCAKPLEEVVFSELAPENFLKTKAGINSVLNNAYAIQQRHNQKAFDAIATFQMPTGEIWNRGGSIETDLTPMLNYTWDSNAGRLSGEWTDSYQAIRDVNLVLDNLALGNFDADFVKNITAEAKFLRAKSMIDIYDLFGTGPMFLSSTFDKLQKARASDSEWVAQIVKDMTEAMNDLPAKPAYGRASSGSAAGILCKFYLNLKKWNESLTMAEKVISSGRYDLFPTYIELFAIANEGNKEIVYTHTATSAGSNSAVQTNALVFPPDYARPSTIGLFAARIYFFDSFVDSFHPNDSRQAMLVKSHLNTAGKTIVGYGVNETIAGKYELDKNANGSNHSNDWPEIRYADILLSKAEALNELNGPSKESIDLINRIRTRAKVPQLLLSDFSSKEKLRSAILDERAWEFAFEGKRRQDEIRHGVMISRAKARKKNAQPHHVLFPIPQSEIDANKELKQNPGY